MTRAMRNNRYVEGETIGQENYSSEDPPHLSDLERVIQTARRATKDLKNHVWVRLVETHECMSQDSKGNVMGE